MFYLFYFVVVSQDNYKQFKLKLTIKKCKKTTTTQQQKQKQKQRRKNNNYKKKQNRLN